MGRVVVFAVLKVWRDLQTLTETAWLKINLSSVVALKPINPPIQPLGTD